MLTLLSKIFIKENSEKRSAYGVLCGAYGIFLNIVLFCAKFFAGTITESIAIRADAFNNLSDAGSSLLSLLGFKLSSKKPDPDHPFGHGRFEYISGLFVSVLILIMGFDLGKTSVLKIFHPEPIDAAPVAIAILVASILVKFYMSFYNRRIGKKINSVSMLATATDSLSDTISTAVVLICTLISRFTDINLDAYGGIFVAAFILWAGIKSTSDTIRPLLGQPPEKDFVDAIENLVLSDPLVLGVHDLVVHDYGPGRVMISLHAEVSASGDILEIHDAIDVLERRLYMELGAQATIHMDPVCADDEHTNALKAIALSAIEKIDPVITMHDFRIVSGPTHTNLIFDIVVPHGYKLSDDELRSKIGELIRQENEDYFCVITVDKRMV